MPRRRIVRTPLEKRQFQQAKRQRKTAWQRVYRSRIRSEKKSNNRG